MNLLSNAIKFQSEGIIFVEATIEKFIELSGPCHKIKVKVKDQGIGIEPERLSEIF